MKDSKYYKKVFKSKNRNGLLLTKFLLSVILVLSCLSICNVSSNFKKIFTRNVLEDNINFSSFHKLYDKIIGDFNPEDTVVVADEVNSIHQLSKEKIDDSYKIFVGNDFVVDFLKSGIIVYNGDKDNLGNTVIVQGNDGVDIWYSNVSMSEYSLYDYVREGEILGNSVEENIFITIMKDGKALNYEDYFA